MAITCFRPSKANSDTFSSSCRRALGATLRSWLPSPPRLSRPATASFLHHFPPSLPTAPTFTDCRRRSTEPNLSLLHPLPRGPTLRLLWQNKPPEFRFYKDSKSQTGRCVADPLTSCFSKNGRMSSRAWWPMVECSCSKVLAAASLTSSSGSHRAFLAVGTRDSEKYSTYNSTRALYLTRQRRGGRGPPAQPSHHQPRWLDF